MIQMLTWCAWYIGQCSTPLSTIFCAKISLWHHQHLIGTVDQSWTHCTDVKGIPCLGWANWDAKMRHTDSIQPLILVQNRPLFNMSVQNTCRSLDLLFSGFQFTDTKPQRWAIWNVASYNGWTTATGEQLCNNCINAATTPGGMASEALYGMGWQG